MRILFIQTYQKTQLQELPLSPVRLDLIVARLF